MQSTSELTQHAILSTYSFEILQESRQVDISELRLDPTAPDPPALISVKVNKFSRSTLGAAKALIVLIAGTSSLVNMAIVRG